MNREPHGSLFLCPQKGFVFVSGGVADVATLSNSLMFAAHFY